MHLHNFFRRRTKRDAPTPDADQDYEEFVDHIRRAIKRLGPEANVDSASCAGPVPEVELELVVRKERGPI
jgi:hypothetical protein